MTISEKIDWSNIYKNIQKFSSSAIKEFVSESLSYLYSLENNPLYKIINFEEKEEKNTYTLETINYLKKKYYQ